MDQPDSTDVTDGDASSPRHGEWLLALGRASLAAARVAGISFDLLRVLGPHDSSSLYSDPLGKLQRKLNTLHAGAELPQLALFLELLGPARDARNDLLHALPVRDGLYRRRSDDAHYARKFFTVESLDDVTAQCDAARRAGSEALYSDGGAAIAAWYARGGKPTT